MIEQFIIGFNLTFAVMLAAAALIQKGFARAALVFFLAFMGAGVVISLGVIGTWAEVTGRVSEGKGGDFAVELVGGRMGLSVLLTLWGVLTVLALGRVL